MFVFGNLVFAVAKLLDFVINAYILVIIVSAVMSWLSPDPYNPIVRFIHSVVDPFLDVIRRTLPFLVGPMDFTPIVAILILYFTQNFLVNSLYGLAMRMR